jgi:hypothetical protein
VGREVTWLYFTAIVLTGERIVLEKTVVAYTGFIDTHVWA